MKKVIRRGVFETNSSSTHSITLCSKDEYDKWEKGEMLFDEDANVFVPISEKDTYKPKYSWCELQTSDEYWNNNELETFEDTYTTKSGETVVAFGKYGYDG